MTYPPDAISVAEALQFESRGNKHGARRMWSELCQRTFASKMEAERGEHLWMLQEAVEIHALTFQPRFVLCEKPKLTYTADFSYRLAKSYPGMDTYIVEDVKGIVQRDSRTRILWTQEKYGVRVKIVQRDGKDWEETYLGE